MAHKQGEKQLYFDHQGQGSDSGSQCQRAGVSHKDRCWIPIVPEKPKTCSCHSAMANTASSPAPRWKDQVEEICKVCAACAVTNCGKPKCDYCSNTCCQSVQSIGKVHCVGHSRNKKHGNGNVDQPAEINVPPNHPSL